MALIVGLSFIFLPLYRSEGDKKEKRNVSKTVNIYFALVVSLLRVGLVTGLVAQRWLEIAREVWLWWWW
jgi:hypothetical protein